jgi:cell division protein FtsB
METVMSGRDAASIMPRLDVFDQEFGCEPEAIPREELPKSKPRIWTFLGLVVAAAIISALAVAWSGAGGPFRLEVATAPTASQGPPADAAKQQIDRLTRQIETLEQEIRDLTEAQRQAASTIAVLKAEQESGGPPSAAYWYSDLAALHFGMPNQVYEPDVVAAPARRPMTARPEARELRRRENGGSAPLSLEAPQ